MWLRGTPLQTRIRKLSTCCPSLAESTSTDAALLKSFILFMICTLLPLRDGCLYMRRCGFSPPDKTGYPVPGSDCRRWRSVHRAVREPVAAKAVGYPTSEVN